jgi:DNA-binding transcriptional ArsR family regulator
MELMVKAMKCKVGNPLRKLVLIKLADNANDQGECWPSYQHIADQCEIGKSTVRKHIKDLETSGLLKIENRKGPKGNASNIYRLTLNGVSPDSTGVSPDSTPPVAPDSTGISHSFEPVIEPNDLCVLFESFWKSYPRKNNKQGALKSFKAALKNQNLTASEFTEMLVSDVSERIKRKQFGFYKLHATTYLNNERWNDPHEENQPRVTESGYKPNSIDAYNERLLAKYGHASAPIEREINPVDGSGLG